MLINQTVQAAVSNKRLKDFLVADEVDPKIVDWSADPDSSVEAIKMKGVDLSWDHNTESGGQASHLTLQDIDLEVTRGTLVAVVGKVGASKSSLLSGLLGEMEKLRGYIGMKGRCAYVPQVCDTCRCSPCEKISDSHFSRHGYKT